MSAQLLAELERIATLIFDCSGSALLAGEKCQPEDRAIIYKKLCEAGRSVEALKDLLPAPPTERA